MVYNPEKTHSFPHNIRTSCCTVYLRTRWDPLGIVELRKLMSTFETMCPLIGLLEGMVPNLEGA